MIISFLSLAVFSFMKKKLWLTVWRCRLDGKGQTKDLMEVLTLIYYYYYFLLKFYRLDVGDGKDLDLKDCSLSKLRKQCIKYLGPVCASMGLLF